MRFYTFNPFRSPQVVWLAVLVIISFLQRVAQCEEANILKPGPQLPTFPTNTDTLSQGNVYVEITPFSYEGGTPGRGGRTAHERGKFYDQFMAHLGVTDQLEVRVYGSGMTWGEGRAVAGERNSSFAPLSFSTVYKFWDEGAQHPLVPAFAVEASVNTQWLGNAQSNSGTNPGFQFAFSKELYWGTNLNFSFGPMRAISSGGMNGRPYNQAHWDFLFQWALQRDILENQLSIYAHGFYNGTQSETLPAETNANAVPLIYSGKAVVGGGLIWTITKRFATFGQISGGLNDVSPALSSWMGFAMAF